MKLLFNYNELSPANKTRIRRVLNEQSPKKNDPEAELKALQKELKDMEDAAAKADALRKKKVEDANREADALATGSTETTDELRKRSEESAKRSEERLKQFKLDQEASEKRRNDILNKKPETSPVEAPKAPSKSSRSVEDEMNEIVKGLGIGSDKPKDMKPAAIRKLLDLKQRHKDSIEAEKQDYEAPGGSIRKLWSKLPSGNKFETERSEIDTQIKDLRSKYLKNLKRPRVRIPKEVDKDKRFGFGAKLPAPVEKRYPNIVQKPKVKRYIPKYREQPKQAPEVHTQPSAPQHIPTPKTTPHTDVISSYDNVAKAARNRSIYCCCSWTELLSTNGLKQERLV